MSDTETLRLVERSLGDGALVRLGVTWVVPFHEPRFTPLEGDRISIGRSGECAIHLPVAGVSRRHAEIERLGAEWVLRDLTSMNGTYVDGERITQASLAEQQTLRVGDALGVLVSYPSDLEEASFSELASGLLGGTRLQLLVAEARRIASSELSVVIEGETGTGKEQVAQALHHWAEPNGAFVAINCAALPEQLAESELFGHRRGAFTGADRAHPGLLRAANQGTLFLDEAQALSPAVQATLLRALETREVLPLGETRSVPFEARIIAAVQGSLSEAVQRGSFREDLYARLAEYTVELPPLRQRREDVPYLFRHLLETALGCPPPPIDPLVLAALCDSPWPQNVRELRSVARRVAVLHGAEPRLEVQHLPPEVRRRPAREPPSAPAEPSRSSPNFRRDASREELDCLLKALQRHRGNVRRAVDEVGISRQRAYRLFEMFPESAPPKSRT